MLKPIFWLADHLTIRRMAIGKSGNFVDLLARQLQRLRALSHDALQTGHSIAFAERLRVAHASFRSRHLLSEPAPNS